MQQSTYPLNATQASSVSSWFLFWFQQLWAKPTLRKTLTCLEWRPKVNNRSLKWSNTVGSLTQVKLEWFWSTLTYLAMLRTTIPRTMILHRIWKSLMVWNEISTPLRMLQRYPWCSSWRPRGLRQHSLVNRYSRRYKNCQATMFSLRMFEIHSKYCWINK